MANHYQSLPGGSDGRRYHSLLIVRRRCHSTVLRDRSLFEDYRSLRAKLYLVRNISYGIAIWRLGYEDARIWQEISAGLK